MQRVFPYQYWDVLPYLKTDGLNFFFKEAAFKKDFDISLVLAWQKLDVLHRKFFEAEEPLKSDVKKCFKQIAQESHAARVANLRLLIEDN